MKVTANSISKRDNPVKVTFENLVYEVNVKLGRAEAKLQKRSY
jgi:hypothetical protein